MLFCTNFIYVPITGCISPGTDRNQVGPLPMHSSSAGGATRPRGGHLRGRGTTLKRYGTTFLFWTSAFQARAPRLPLVLPAWFQRRSAPAATLPGLRQQRRQVYCRARAVQPTKHATQQLDVQARLLLVLSAKFQRSSVSAAVSPSGSSTAGPVFFLFLNISIYVSKNIIMLHSLFNWRFIESFILTLFCLNPVIIIFVYQSQ
jgi:hypothetical protein